MQYATTGLVFLIQHASALQRRLVLASRLFEGIHGIWVWRYTYTKNHTFSHSINAFVIWEVNKDTLNYDNKKSCTTTSVWSPFTLRNFWYPWLVSLFLGNILNYLNLFPHLVDRSGKGLHKFFSFPWLQNFAFPWADWGLPWMISQFPYQHSALPSNYLKRFPCSLTWIPRFFCEFRIPMTKLIVLGQDQDLLEWSPLFSLFVERISDSFLNLSSRFLW